MQYTKLPIAALVLLAVVTVAPVSAASGSQTTHAYAGSHVSFGLQGSTMTNYTVNGQTVVQSLGVQSRSKAQSSGLLGASGSIQLSSMTSLKAAGLSVGAKSRTSARVKAKSGARLTAHDDSHGILVMNASSGSGSQVFVANLSSGSSAKSNGKRMVSVTTANGTQATFIAVGNASVAVNNQGNVSGTVGSNGRIVLRSYPNGKTQADQHAEGLIASGKATGEVYVTGGSNAKADVISYANNTTVSAAQSGSSTVNVTVDRTTHQGTIVITSVSKAAVGSTNNLHVTVSGKAAAKASSYSNLESAIGGGNSAYFVKQNTHAKGNATVFIAFNHFSKRTASISSSSSPTTTSSSSGTSTSTTTTGSSSSTSTSSSGSGAGGSTTSSSSPGFTLIEGLTALAVLGGVLYARSR